MPIAYCLHFPGRSRDDGQRMHSPVKLVLEHRVDHPVPLDPALSRKGQRHRMQLEMRLALRARPGMAAMQMRLILERQFRIGKCPREFRKNRLADGSERHLAT